MIFKSEAEFENALIEVLQKKGWEREILKSPSEADLIANWAQILFENNRSIDRLNDTPLTSSEMRQIMEQIITLRTPLRLNGFINGKTVTIKRDNIKDPLHYGKEISLKIYDRHEIAAGQSRYQIAQQPKYKAKSKILNSRRGDLMLLINGMPVIHIELKKNGIPVSQAYNQIEKYSDEGVFTDIFSLVQVFVAMQPEETVYFANPGPDGKFNKDYYFHWADFNNEPLNNWKDVASHLLSIPMAHQLIGFYTVADDSDGVLKVMRSYQYYAANAISDKVSKHDWSISDQLGGYIWHTTGSGKTMTSFKSAQLIANSKDADKVVFLMDRIELGTQSLYEYRAFADENEEVQATEDTNALITKLKSTNPADILIVTSIQKMSNIKNEGIGLNSSDIEIINNKRITFIVDEAHRSTFGEMLSTIKFTFPNAIFFGFTGTPIHHENEKKKNTTSTIFGDELHRYSIADGIRDENVLGFDPYKIMTYRNKDLRKAVALHQANASTEEEALANEGKRKIYYHYMDKDNVKMAGYFDRTGKYIKGIEDYLPLSQYNRLEHRNKVVEDITSNWDRLSRSGKFHAIFATSSIAEAIKYYRLFKENHPSLKVTTLFDPNIDNNGNIKFKEEGLIEIIEDYNNRYEQDFGLATYGKFKKDIAARLAHKKPYNFIEQYPMKQIDILIVVDQMLTGYDSKWINTLYLDKVLKYESIIQAFSRTNRLFGHEKKFGTIKYYRMPNTMEKHIEKAVSLYSGNRPLGMFVEHLDYNLDKMNQLFDDITRLFNLAGVSNFTKLPNEVIDCAKFAKLFNTFNSYLEAAKIQGFVWSKDTYQFSKPKKSISINFDETKYLILVQRYKELSYPGPNSNPINAPYEIEGYLTEFDTDRIDSNYMNNRFEKYLKILHQDIVNSDELQDTLNDLHQSFATLTQEEQKYANIFIHDVQSGNAILEEGKTFKDYVMDYQYQAKNNEVIQLVETFELDAEILQRMMEIGVSESNINEYGRFDELKKSVNETKAKKYFETRESKVIPDFRLKIKVENLLKKFIFNGGFDINDDNIE